jgi:cytochrome b561
MTADEKSFNERESLQLISEMIGKAKSNFHESGTSAILWGTVVGICGLISFAQQQWHFSIGFDIWWLTLAAVIPQVWISIRESKRRTVKTHAQFATDVVWTVYAISLVALVLYGNIVPGVSDRMFAEEGTQLLSKNATTGELTQLHVFLPSMSSVFLIIYAFPTLATGLINKFKAMVLGAVICYVFFVLSLYTSFKYDMLLSGLAGIANWLIPGLILRNRYLKGKAC